METAKKYIIYAKDGVTEVYNGYFTDDSYYKEELEDNILVRKLFVKIMAFEEISFSAGCYLYYNRIKFSIKTDENIEKHHDKLFTYEFTMYDDTFDLKRWIIKDLTGSSRFNLTANLDTCADLILHNLNSRTERDVIVDPTQITETEAEGEVTRGVKNYFIAKYPYISAGDGNNKVYFKNTYWEVVSETGTQKNTYFYFYGVDLRELHHKTVQFSVGLYCKNKHFITFRVNFYYKKPDGTTASKSYSKSLNIQGNVYLKLIIPDFLGDIEDIEAFYYNYKTKGLFSCWGRDYQSNELPFYILGDFMLAPVETESEYVPPQIDLPQQSDFEIDLRNWAATTSSLDVLVTKQRALITVKKETWNYFAKTFTYDNDLCGKKIRFYFTVKANPQFYKDGRKYGFIMPYISFRTINISDDSVDEPIAYYFTYLVIGESPQTYMFEFPFSMDCNVYKVTSFTTGLKIQEIQSIEVSDVRVMLEDPNSTSSPGETNHTDKYYKGLIQNSTEKLYSADGNYLWDFLADMLNQNNTEARFTFNTSGQAYLNIHRLQFNTAHPLQLQYGQYKGIREDLKRTHDDDNFRISRLIVQGTDRNIVATEYGSRYLLLPKNQELEYLGVTYKTSADGYEITIKDNSNDNGNEDVYSNDEIYPTWIGEVTSIETEDSSSSVFSMHNEDVLSRGTSMPPATAKPERFQIYTISDNNIPDNLNFEDYIIPGTTMTIIFQSGMLTGQEFDVKYTHIGRSFKIVPKNIEGTGLLIPNTEGGFVPKVGDKFAVFNIIMPKEYICNNTDKTGASWDLFRKAVETFEEKNRNAFKYNLEIDDQFVRNNLHLTNDRFSVGNMVRFEDKQLTNGQALTIRMVGVQKYINDKYKYTISLSEKIEKKTKLSDIEADIAVIETDLHRGLGDLKDRARRYNVISNLASEQTRGSMQESQEPFVKRYEVPTKSDIISATQHGKGKATIAQFYTAEGELCYVDIFSYTDRVEWSARREITGFIVIK